MYEKAVMCLPLTPFSLLGQSDCYTVHGIAAVLLPVRANLHEGLCCKCDSLNV